MLQTENCRWDLEWGVKEKNNRPKIIHWFLLLHQKENLEVHLPSAFHFCSPLSQPASHPLFLKPRVNYRRVYNKNNSSSDCSNFWGNLQDWWLSQPCRAFAQLFLQVGWSEPLTGALNREKRTPSVHPWPHSLIFFPDVANWHHPPKLPSHSLPLGRCPRGRHASSAHALPWAQHNSEHPELWLQSEERTVGPNTQPLRWRASTASNGREKLPGRFFIWKT